MSKTAVFCIAKNFPQAERIAASLQHSGFPISEISIVYPEGSTHHDVGHVKATKAPEGVATGVASGGVAGGVIGLLAGMGLAEALSDDGEVSGRGNPITRGGITGVATMIGGMLHTMPFLISNLSFALNIAYLVVMVELLGIAFIRYRFMRTPLVNTIVQVILGGLIVFGVGLWLGKLGVND